MARAVVALLAAALLGGCGAFRVAPDTASPGIPGGILGRVLPNPDGGPPIECRAVPDRACVDARNVARNPHVNLSDVTRIIVTCTSTVCTLEQGDARIDLVLGDGTLQPAGGINWVGD